MQYVISARSLVLLLYYFSITSPLNEKQKLKTYEQNRLNYWQENLGTICADTFGLTFLAFACTEHDTETPKAPSGVESVTSG